MANSLYSGTGSFQDPATTEGFPFPYGALDVERDGNELNAILDVNGMALDVRMGDVVHMEWKRSTDAGWVALAPKGITQANVSGADTQMLFVVEQGAIAGAVWNFRARVSRP
jgi:hypothetical protein